jgi:cell division septal protein FtsQ
MVKRKQSPSLNPDIVRTVGLVCIFVLGIALAVMAMVTLLRGVFASPLFTVRSIMIADNIQPLELPELTKLKGRNLFAADLSKLEAKVRARYPQLADVRVMRHFPDQIWVTAIKCEPFAKVSIDGRLSVIDRYGYMMGSPLDGQESLTVQDERVKLGVMIMTLFHQDKRLSSVGLETVNVEDLARIVCDLGGEEGEFQVFIDKDNIAARLKTLSEVLSRGGLDLQQIKYMDLRFGEPILGQKKVKK